MKIGLYSAKLVCDGYAGFGSARFDGNRLTGETENYRMDGEISEAGHRLTATIEVDLAPGVSGNSRIAGAFTCAMTGASTDHSFDLYGVGLLGIIIGIQCQWAGSLDGRVGDRRAVPMP